MTIYMRVSRNKYELPEAVPDSVIEFANMFHINWSSIYKAVFKELFRRVQEDFGVMEDVIRRIGEKNAESAEKLRTAVQALVKRWAV